MKFIDIKEKYSSEKQNKQGFFVQYELKPLNGKQMSDYFSSNYNLIGLDNGDAELTASRVIINEKQIPETVSLAFNKQGQYYAPNIIRYDGKQAQLVNENNLGKGNIYSNFKRCPGDPTIEQKYNNNAGMPTYKELMSHSFAAALKCLFENNTALDEKKPTIVMVGRPASKLWEEYEKTYGEILGEKIPQYLPNNAAVFILVVAESCAAMAGALGMERENWENGVTQIVDAGSSTFDSFIITPQGVPEDAEDSFQFGGNDLDKAIVEYGDYLFEKNYPPDQGYCMCPDPRRKIALRFKKELCYGEIGTEEYYNPDKNKYHYIICWKKEDGSIEELIDEVTEDPKAFNFPVSRKIMERICTNNPQTGYPLDSLKCKAKRLVNNAFQEEIQQKSWYDTCKYVMGKFYERSKKYYTNSRGNKSVPDRLILSGGVVNMPEVRELAKQVFGVETEITKNPKHTVSAGLGLILGSELAKELLMRELKTFDLPEKEQLRKAMVLAACNSDLDYYEKTIEIWAQGNGKKTIAECIDLLCGENNLFNPKDDFVGRAVAQLYRNANLNKTIENQVKKKLENLLPNAPEIFAFKVDFSAIKGIAARELENDYQINVGFFFNENNYPDPFALNIPYDVHERNNILQIFRAHRDILLTGGRLEYPKGIVEIPGIYDVYSIQITEKDADQCLKLIEKYLKKEVRRYVEGMTYYLSLFRRD